MLQAGIRKTLVKRHFQPRCPLSLWRCSIYSFSSTHRQYFACYRLYACQFI